MSTRLQVVMPEAELDEIRDAARRNRVTVSAWVRRALREARERELRGGSVFAVREAEPRYGADESAGLRFVDLEGDGCPSASWRRYASGTDEPIGRRP